MTDLVTSDDIMAAVIELAGPPAAPAPLIPDGVFLNMPEEVYHADPALGSTDLKAILTNPVQWFNRTRWDERDEGGNLIREVVFPPEAEESAGKAFGRALHKIALEGVEAFEAAYLVEPEPPAGLIEKNEELFAFISERATAPVVGMQRWFHGLPQPMIDQLIGAKGQPLKTARKEALTAAARHLGCTTLKVDWEAAVLAEAGGRTIISAEWWRKLHLIRRVLDRHSRAPQVLSKGRAEVSIFWTDEAGLRLKARFDYLRTRVVCDLKTYACRDGQDPVETFVRAIEQYAYDLSREHYMDARVNALPRLVEAGAMFDCSMGQTPGDNGTAFILEDDAAFLQRVAAEPEPAWLWVAAMTMGWPEVDVVEMPPALMAATAAETQLAEAKAKYREFRERFGQDNRTPWVSDRGIVVVTDAMFSMRQVNRGAARYETRDD